MVRGANWRETMKECTSARSIFEERGREHALLHAVAEPSKINELGGQALLILYEEGQFINLNHFTSNCLMITFILASIYSDVRGVGPLLPPVFAIVRASER